MSVAQHTMEQYFFEDEMVVIGTRFVHGPIVLSNVLPHSGIRQGSRIMPRC